MVNCVKGINIEAISCAVPARKLSIQEYAPDLLTEKSAKRMAKGTGFSSLRISDDDTTTADLVVAAAEPLLDDFGRENIGALIFVSQTPDYVLPATSHILQAKLGLPNNIFCVDINEGCSGYITGLYTAGMLAKQINKSVCLLGGTLFLKLHLLRIGQLDVFLVMLGQRLLFHQESRTLILFLLVMVIDQMQLLWKIADIVKLRILSMMAICTLMVLV